MSNIRNQATLYKILKFSGLKQDRSSGFTLPELLVSTVIFALLAGITAAVMVGQLQQGRRLEQAQRVRENISRLNYLIQVEASEATQIVTPPLRITGPGSGSNPCRGLETSTGFTLLIPNPDLEYGSRSQQEYVKVYYYNNAANGSISRCGPRVTRNGRLNISVDTNNGNPPPSPLNGIVLPNASFIANSIGLSAGDLSVEYAVNFSTGNLDAAGPGRIAKAHAKSVFVCNPPVGNQPSDIGEC